MMGDAEAGEEQAQQGADEASWRYLALRFPQNPEVVHTVQHEYAVAGSACPHGNFTKGVRWSPDGACLLTASDDGWMRVYDLPPDTLERPAPPLHPLDAAGGGAAAAQTRPWDPARDADTMGAALRVQEGECVYDYAWFSRMSVQEPQSCCFATTSRGRPVHLWDACSGELRASYRGYNDVDEVTPAFSLAFSPDGAKLYAGYTKYMLEFDVARPGRDSVRVACVVQGPGRYSAKLPGMVSCLACSPDGGALAAGSYSSTLGVFDPRAKPALQLLLQGHKGGLTQVAYTADGHFLLSGARQDADLICWDLRVAGGGAGDGAGERAVLYRLPRDTAGTNQRVAFSLEPCGRHLATGGCNGAVKVFDLQTGGLVDELPVASDTVNGCDLHPSANLLAVSTGQRRWEAPDEEDSEAPEPGGVRNALRVLRMRYDMVDVEPPPAPQES